MSNIKTSLKIAILSVIGLIMSWICYKIVGIDLIVYIVFGFAICLAVSLGFYISGFIRRYFSKSKNINAIFVFLFGALISFSFDSFFESFETMVFYLCGIICVVLLFISIFIYVTRKLFKKEIKDITEPKISTANVNDKTDNTKTDENISDDIRE